MPQLLSHSLPPFSVRAGITGLFSGSGELLWRRSFIAGSLADNGRMTAIQSARKRILYGNSIWKRPPYQGSAYAFLVLLIRFYEGARLTRQTSKSGTKRT
jgi:hypothetical protein